MKGWDRQRSSGRIRVFMGTVPQGNISVRTFDEGMLQRRMADIALNRALGSLNETVDRIFDVSPGKAIVVDGVHVYVQLIDYAQQMLDISNETEPGHRKLLQALHVHYAACDSVAEEFGAQRVDYHGPRMHAVIATPIGNERDRVIRALEFADAVKRTIEEVGNKVAGGTLRTRVRIGIDTGKAVAIDSGNSGEREPLFLGNPANYAAKLADGEVPGIFPSANVRRVLTLDVPHGGLSVEQTRSISAFDVQRVQPGRRIVADAQLVTRAVSKVEERFPNGDALPTFVFHRHEPPLRTIDFAAVSPSNSIRMDLMSVFADIDKFTAYVDRCISTGNVAEMVSNLHVIRGELAATLKEDFDGRKIRFIGDCIHGIVANGTRSETDRLESVRSAVAAAAGMRSSFELCQQMLPGIANLGLAIGIDIGTTPVTRIGLRGDRSVRCCVSKAVSSSEDLQSASEGDETKIGTRARAAAPAAIQRFFDAEGVAVGLDYASYMQHVGPPAVVKSGTVSRPALPYLR